MNIIIALWGGLPLLEIEAHMSKVQPISINYYLNKNDITETFI